MLVICIKTSDTFAKNGVPPIYKGKKYNVVDTYCGICSRGETYYILAEASKLDLYHPSLFREISDLTFDDLVEEECQRNRTTLIEAY